MPYKSGFRADLFRGQTILVTGGGGGLGRCIAHELAALGARLVLAGRTGEKLDRVALEITEDGGEVAGTCSGDLRDEELVVATVGRILAEHGQLHGLVNATGGQFPARLQDLSLNGWNAVINNNLTSYFLVSREVYRQCFEQSGGNIVHIGADYDGGMPGMGHNGAARAGLSNLTQTSAIEWAQAGVRVNCVLPGIIATTGLDRYPKSAWDSLRNATEEIPMARHGNSAEISAAVVFLMSELASYITGIDLLVDGGMRLGSGNILFHAENRRIVPAFDGFHRDESASFLQT